MPNGVTGTGTTIAFTDSSLTLSVISIGSWSASRGAVDDSHLGTTVNREYTPEDLESLEEFDVTFYMAPRVADSFNGTSATPEVITITYALDTAGATAATTIGTGWISKWAGPDIGINEKMIGSLSVQWDGKTTPAFAAETGP